MFKLLRKYTSAEPLHDLSLLDDEPQPMKPMTDLLWVFVGCLIGFPAALAAIALYRWWVG